MLYRRTQVSSHGVVLIVVIGVLAVLSLLAATFGMLMMVELAASRNQSEYEMARQGAHAGYEFLLGSLADYGIEQLAAGTPSHFCPEPGNPLFCHALPGPGNLKIGFMIHSAENEPPEHADLVGKEWATGLGLEKTGMFNVNAMGRSGDSGDDTYQGVLYSSYDISLARLLKSRFDELPTGGANDIDTYYTTWNDVRRWRVAQHLASAIISYRYGKDGVPGDRGIENHACGNRSASIYWPGLWSSDDGGVPVPGHCWGSAAGGSVDSLNQLVLDTGTLTAIPVGNDLTDSTRKWADDEHRGHVVTIVASTVAADGQSLLIKGNTDQVLTLFSSWAPAPAIGDTYIIQTREDYWYQDRWANAYVWAFPNPFDEDMRHFGNSNTNKGACLRAPAANPSDFDCLLSLTRVSPASPVPPPEWPGGGPFFSDAFCINTTGANTIGATDNIPTALVWPNGPVVGERYVFPRNISRPGTLLEITGAQQVRIDQVWPNNIFRESDGTFRNATIRITDGAGRGQVRRITDNTGNLLDLDAGWTTTPNPVVTSGSLTAADALGRSVTDSLQAWAVNVHKGRVILLGGSSTANVNGQYAIIQSNTATEIVVEDAFSFVPVPPGDNTTYQILDKGYVIEHDAFDSGTITARTNDTLTQSVASKGYSWQDDAYIGCVVNIVSDGGAPDAVGQTRLIIDNDSATLTLARRWRDTPSVGARYRIEMRQDDKYRPDAPQGDDRIYHSVAEVLPVMKEALRDDPYHVFSSTDIDEVAAILYDSFRDYLTVSNRATTRQQESVGINDWATDGIDNDDNGLIDDESPTTAELALALYEGLWLKEWAASDAGRIEDAAQLIANIIDFRDSDDVPTAVTASDIGEGGAFGGERYGYEGVHFTEVMATPVRVDVDGTFTNNYITSDGGTGGDGDVTGADDDDSAIPPLSAPANDANTDADGWDWDGANGCWYVCEVATGTAVTGDWTFTGLRNGWYAIRILGGDGDTLGFYHAPPSGPPPPPIAVTVTMNRPETATESWGYVRRNGARLAAVEVSGGNLDIRLTGYNLTGAPADGDRFFGLQLLPQYVETTNCAAHDVELDRVDCGSGEIQLPVGARIAGAAADGNFPIAYGTYVVAMSEEAYERQWTQGLGGAKNHNGTWGDEADEAYPVYFVGDLSDDDADRMLVSASSPVIEVKSRGVAIASAGPSGFDGNPTASGACTDYVAREKSGTPFSTTWADFPGAGADLAGSQNVGPTGAAGMAYTCLNRSYNNIWGAYPILNNSGAFSPANSGRVLPIILNRPYPTAGWLGLVPTGNDPWRTVDPDPSPSDSPAGVEELLGTLMKYARTGGAHARINPNNPSAPLRLHTLQAVLPDSAARTLARQIDSGTSDGTVPPLNSNELQDTAKTWGVDVYTGFTAYIYAGTGRGQTRQIMSNTAVTLTLDSDWATDPDVTSLYAIFGPAYAQLDSGTGDGTAPPLNANELQDTTKTWVPNFFRDYTVEILAGTGVGQRRRITVNTGTLLTVDPDWNPTPDATSQYAVTVSAWENWDEMLNNSDVQAISNRTSGPEQEDSGAGTFADDFLNDSDEAEEWARRYSNVLDLRTANLKYVVAGFVYEADAIPGDAPVAQVRIEVELDISGDELRVVQFRYLTD